MKTIYQHIRLGFASVLMAGCVALAGCVEDESMCPSQPEDKPGVHLRFDIVTRATGTGYRGQSRELVVPPNTQKGSIDENFLDIPNLAFVLFDADQRLLMPFFPAVSPEEGSDYVKYSVNAFITDPYFTEAAPDSELTFYIMVLANYSGHNTDRVNFTRGIKLSEMFGPDGSPSFATPKGSPWWHPHRDDLTQAGYWPGTPQYMPMAGLQRFKVSVAALNATTEESRLQLPDDINMLRAMAKIEVVDRINAVGTGTNTVIPPKAERAYIEKVEMEGYNSRGALLPTFAQWSINGSIETQYVKSPTIPTSAEYRPSFEFGNQVDGYQDAILYFGEDEDATAAREDKCQVFSVYIPEYAVPTDGSTKAWMQVTITDPNNVDQFGAVFSVLYELRLASFENGKPVAEIPVLRNTIYRYEIESISSNLIKVNWTVCPMDEATVNIPSFN